MKKLCNYIEVLSLCIMVVFMSGCSSDYDKSADNDFSNMKFKINVDILDEGETRAASDFKTNWAEGDKMYLMVDDNSSQICYIEFSNNDWVIKKEGSMEPNFMDNGNIKAVYAEKISYVSANKISTTKDILYGENGNYYKDADGFIVINILLDQRPMSKIRINGIPNGYNKITGLVECTSLDFTTMIWTDESKMEGKACCDKETKDNAYTFYGNLAPNGSDQTVIKLSYNYSLAGSTDVYTANYIRTYDKKFEKGKHYIIQGPETSEKNEWYAEAIPVPKTTSKGISVALGVDTVSITRLYELLIKNPTHPEVTYVSSDASVAEVVGNKIVTHKEGTTNINVQTTDNSSLSLSIKVVAATPKEGKSEFNGLPGFEFNAKDCFTWIAPVPLESRQTVTYKSDNEAVASVATDGTITCNTVGSAKITVTSVDNKECSFNVKVSNVEDYIALTWPSQYLYTTQEVKYTIANSAPDKITLTSAVVTDKNGKIINTLESEQVIDKNKSYTRGFKPDDMASIVDSKLTVTVSYGGKTGSKDLIFSASPIK